MSNPTSNHIINTSGGPAHKYQPYNSSRESHPPLKAPYHHLQPVIIHPCTDQSVAAIDRLEDTKPLIVRRGIARLRLGLTNPQDAGLTIQLVQETVTGQMRPTRPCRRHQHAHNLPGKVKSIYQRKVREQGGWCHDNRIQASEGAYDMTIQVRLEWLELHVRASTTKLPPQGSRITLHLLKSMTAFNISTS
jgi:hypothetical protein